MQLQNYTRKTLYNYAQHREGETKLLDSVILATLDQLAEYDSSFVILGIPEDIGVRANLGIGGAHTLWPAFLSSFLSMQSNIHISGRDIILLGHIDIDRSKTNALNLEGMRGLTSMLDEVVAPIILRILQAGHIPIVVGGGHNNAFPIIQATAEYNGHPIKVLNMDLHHDFRPLEGRHSGNSFSYAMHEGTLDAYLMWGLSKYYSQQSFLDDWAQNESLFAVFYETLLTNSLEQNLTLLGDYIKSLGVEKLGIEVDLDSVEGMLSSAMTPSGFSPKEIRAYVSQVATMRPWYLHVCEGAAKRDDGQQDTVVGKMTAYIVADFISRYKMSHNSV